MVSLNWSTSFCGSVHKRAKEKNQTNIFPVQTKQANSVTFLLLCLYFEFPDSIAHLYWRDVRTIKTKPLFLSCLFRRRLPKFWVRQQGKCFYSRQKFRFGYSLKKHKSLKSVRERSISAVRTEKYGLLREPIRMLLFITDPVQPYHNIA